MLLSAALLSSCWSYPVSKALILSPLAKRCLKRNQQHSHTRTQAKNTNDPMNLTHKNEQHHCEPIGARFILSALLTSSFITFSFAAWLPALSTPGWVVSKSRIYLTCFHMFDFITRKRTSSRRECNPFAAEDAWRPQGCLPVWAFQNWFVHTRWSYSPFLPFAYHETRSGQHVLTVTYNWASCV